VKVGDLVNPFCSSKMAGNTEEIGLCVYLGELTYGENTAKILTYYTLLSTDGMIEIPTWHWKLELINESR